MRVYILSVTITSNGSEDRHFTPYDDPATAERKFHEPFNVAGGGPKKITVVMLDENLREVPGYYHQWVEPTVEE